MEVHLVRVADFSRIGSAHSRQETIDRGLGLDLLGKPRKQDYQFANLGEMTYGSEEFRGTAIGEATVMAMDEVVEKAVLLLRPYRAYTWRPARPKSSRSPETRSSSTSEVRTGSTKATASHVYPGDGREDVDPGGRIAVIEVREIIATRVSKVAALSGAGVIAAGDRIELIVGADPQPVDAGSAEPGSPVD